MRVLILVLLLLMTAPHAAGQADETARWYHERCGPLVRKIADEISPALSATEKQALRAATIRCILDPGFGAAASRGTDGKAIITVTSGTVAALDTISTAFALGGAYNKSLCGPLYLDKYGEAVRRNVAHLFAGTAMEPGQSPFEFAKRNRTYCPSVSEEAFRANKLADDMRELLINGGLRFVLAHELAHIVKKHIDEPPETQRESRNRERTCDEFALRVVSAAGLTPFEAAAAVSMLATVDDFAMRADKQSTHPSGGARFLNIAVAGKALMEKDPEIMQMMRNDPDRAERWRQAVKAFEMMAADVDE